MPAEITSPPGTSVHKEEGESFTLRCQGDRTSDLTWYFNSNLISLLPGRYEIRVDINSDSGRKVSLLTKDNLKRNDTGTYTCRDIHLEDEGDSIIVMVGRNGKYSKLRTAQCTTTFSLISTAKVFIASDIVLPRRQTRKLASPVSFLIDNKFCWPISQDEQSFRGPRLNTIQHVKQGDGDLLVVTPVVVGEKQMPMITGC